MECKLKDRALKDESKYIGYIELIKAIKIVCVKQRLRINSNKLEVGRI